MTDTQPSAGFFALALASLRCERVALYGFRPPPRGAHPHYKYFRSKAPLRHLRGADDKEAARAAPCPRTHLCRRTLPCVRDS